MQITPSTDHTIDQLVLHQELKEAVNAYASIHAELNSHLPLNEGIGTPQLWKLTETVEQKRAVVILLAASCVESVANLWLGLKASAEQFAVLERATFIEKWTVVPSYFLEGYTFPKGDELYADLKILHSHRNALVHLKEEISKGGVLVHDGSLLKPTGDEHQFTLRCQTLARRLAEHLAQFDQSVDMSSVMALWLLAAVK
jgi:hypothetical protein